MKFLKPALLLLSGLLLLNSSALAFSVNDVSVGDLDTVLASATVDSSYPAELAWVQSVLGTGYYFSDVDDKYDTEDSWTEVDDFPNYYALELNGSPEYFFIKLGTGDTDIANDHWLYANNEELDWAVVNSEEWGTTSNIDIFRISHIGEVGSAAPVPEPASMLLLGTGLVGLAGISRKKLIKN